MPWNGLVGQHMQGRVCLQSWPLLGPFGRLLADFLRYSYYNRTITVLSYENRTFPYYNRTTTLRTNPVRPHATGPYQPRTTKARFLRNCPLWSEGPELQQHMQQHPAVTSRFYPGFCPELPFFWVLVPGSNPGFSLGDFFREWPKGGTKGVLLPDRVFFTFSWVSADPEPNPVPGRISTPVPNPGFEPRFGPGSGRSGFWFPLRRKPGSPENPEGGR